MSIVKSQTDRVTECLVILDKLKEEVKVPMDNPSIIVLKKRMAHYWREGKMEEDILPLYGFNRNIKYKFPRWSHQFVEMTLRVNKTRGIPDYPADLLEEINKPKTVLEQESILLKEGQ